ncbi:MAG: MarR family transcriptional regulator [Ignavibacteria bacterium]|nr:MarR family transcriptional regulator [Ignavibacteria bacterium]
MGTHYKGSRRTIDSLNSYTKLIRSAESLSSKINLALNDFGLTESQFGVLDALFHLGPMKHKEIGKKILKSGGNITMVINNLERRQLVQRKRGEKDKRQFIIHLTQKGKNKFQELLPHIVKKIKKYFEMLSKEEQKELQRLCKIVGLQIRI